MMFRKVILLLVLIFIGIPMLVVAYFITSTISFPPLTFLTQEVYPRAPVNLCFLSFGTTWSYDYGFSNKEACYLKRANLKNDWRSCLHTDQEGSCLSKISLSSNKYLCDKAESEWQTSSCNRDLFYYGSEKIHTLTGIEKYKISKSITLNNGDPFLLNPIKIVSNNNVEFYGQSLSTCSSSENPPLVVNTIGGGTNNIFITGCKVAGNVVTINYFKYNLQGFIFPEGI